MLLREHLPRVDVRILATDLSTRVLTRGSAWLGEAARRATRLPTGHPEAFLEAFANVYLGVAAHIRALQAGVTPDPLDADYPRLADGVRGVRFIEKVVQSAGSQAKWTAMRD